MFCIILWSETVNENASKERISLSLFFLFIITVEMSLTFALVGISFGMKKSEQIMEDISSILLLLSLKGHYIIVFLLLKA